MIYTMSEEAYKYLAREIGAAKEKDVVDYLNGSLGLKGTITSISRVKVDIPDKKGVKKYENY